jgi:hypothetical protein
MKYEKFMLTIPMPKHIKKLKKCFCIIIKKMKMVLDFNLEMNESLKNIYAKNQQIFLALKKNLYK